MLGSGFMYFYCDVSSFLTNIRTVKNVLVRKDMP